MHKYEQNLLILTSPPASGKTHWVENLILETGAQDLLIVSPLRALADECKRKWGEGVAVVTHEEWLRTKVEKKIVIFDEYHLHFYWGDTFRPKMWEAFYELTYSAELTILLTATLGLEMIDEIKRYSHHFKEITWADYGNSKLKFEPTYYYQAPSRRWIERNILSKKKNQATDLIFCQFRNDVFQWRSKLEANGYRVWTCVGGESKEFSKKIDQEKAPDYIVSTTVLSHGVNLPKITTVYFMYKLKNQHFWIQMVARGGRRGEKFEVYSLEKPYHLKWNQWTNLLKIFMVSLRLIYKEEKRALLLWFLKD